MKVLDSKIIVQVTRDECVTKIGDFVIPEGNTSYEKATVIAVGPEAKGIAEGDNVYIYRDCGKEFEVDGKKYRTITSSEVIVVL